MAEASSERTKEMIEKIKKGREKIEQMLNEFFQKANLTPEKLKEYMENPANFNDREWEVVQKQRSVLEKQLKIFKRGGGVQTEEQLEAKELAQKAKKTRAKLRGGRQNWIQMK